MPEEKLAITLNPGTILAGKYLIRRQLGGGGMGQVFEATQKPINRPVAIKLLHPKYISDEIVQQRFLQEARAASQLTHPNTITIYDFGMTDDDTYFIAMEYVEGQTLADVLDQHGPLPVDDAIPIIIQVAQSLGEAHRKGIIHRDLKPDNIMVVPSPDGPGRVKVLDFGIAKLVDRSAGLTQTGSIFGTPGYMAPEQARGADVTPSADFYALTCCLYELLTGRLPFHGESVFEILMQHQEGEVPSLGNAFPPSLDLFLRRALAKDANARPQAAEDYIAGLMGGLADDASRGHAFRPASPVGSGRLDGPRRTSPSGQLLVSQTLDGSIPGAESSGQRSLQEDFRQFVEKSDTVDAPATPSTDPPTRLDDGRDSDSSLAAQDLLDAEESSRERHDTDDAAPWHRRYRTGLGAAALLAAGIGVGGFFVSASTNNSPASANEAPSVSAANEQQFQITSHPSGATVSIDERRIGVTPVTTGLSDRGSVTIRLRKEGYESVVERDVSAKTYPDGQFFAALSPKTLQLTVTSPVARAQLFVNDQRYGRLASDRPRTLEVDWPESSITVELDAPGYETYLTRIPSAALDEQIEVRPALSDFVAKSADRRTN